MHIPVEGPALLTEYSEVVDSMFVYTLELTLGWYLLVNVRPAVPHNILFYFYFLFLFIIGFHSASNIQGKKIATYILIYM